MQTPLRISRKSTYMKISIAEHLQPFSHEPGTSCLIPLSSWKVTIFPCLSLSPRGFSEKRNFSVYQGASKRVHGDAGFGKGTACVFGFSEEGYFRYVLAQEEEEIALRWEKAPTAGILVKDVLCKGKERIVLFSAQKEEAVKLSSEKLSLGLHKSQDWTMVQRRKDFAEIFPTWLRLGQILPVGAEPKQKKGVLQLLGECEAAIEAQKRTEILPVFLKLFLAGFSGILSPRLQDEDYQGILPEETNVEEKGSLLLLTRGSELIRSLFPGRRC